MSARRQKFKLESILKQAKDGVTPDVMVYRPAQVNGKNVKEVTIIKEQPLPSIKDNIIRIVNEADPMGILIAAAQGQLFEFHVVDKHGNIETYYESVDLGQRLKIARYLADKVMPRLGIVKHVMPTGGGGSDDDGSEGGDGIGDFARLVNKAAEAEDGDDNE